MFRHRDRYVKIFVWFIVLMMLFSVLASLISSR